MVRKKLVTLGMGVFALALAFVAALPVAARAANTQQVNFLLTISASNPAGTTEHTYMRPKNDNSPGYVIANDHSSGAVIGLAGIDGYTLGYTNRTDGGYAYFRALNQHSSILNNVYSSGEYTCWLWMYKTLSAPPNSPTYVDGKWAPDSLATYTIINNGY